MKAYALWFVLLLVSPTFATIAQVQSKPNWSCSGTTCAIAFTSNPTTGNLIAVWTFWQSTSTFTASVFDSPQLNSQFVSAVGPTPQSAASTPTSAQIFYAKNIQNPSNHSDTVTVTFSGTGTITAAGAVIVEYSGLDQNNSLDSVSEAISNSGSPSGALDSGTASPANANLLIFGGGTSDNGTAATSSPFTIVQNSGGSITEQNMAKLKCRVRVPIMVIPHSFGARLNFNPHLHILGVCRRPAGIGRSLG